MSNIDVSMSKLLYEDWIIEFVETNTSVKLLEVEDDIESFMLDVVVSIEVSFWDDNTVKVFVESKEYIDIVALIEFANIMSEVDRIPFELEKVD